MFTAERLTKMKHDLVVFTKQAVADFLLTHPHERFNALGYD